MITALKTGALAVAMLAATVGSSFAATAYADGFAKVHNSPTKASVVVDKLWDGEKVKVGNCTNKNNGWCYISHKGADGWVRMSQLDFGGKWDNDPWPYNGGYNGGYYGPYGGQACVSGPHASFCIGN